MKKFKIIITVFAFVFLTGIVSLRFFSGEDNWICQNGEWVKHGNPKTEKPASGCGVKKEIAISGEEAKDQNKENNTSGKMIVGGPCSYDEQPGECGIVSIAEDGTIKFRFSGDDTFPRQEGNYEDTVSPLHEENANYLDSECVRGLNKYPVTKDDLKNCGIEELKVVSCVKKTITKGTCTPIIFSFN